MIQGHLILGIQSIGTGEDGSAEAAWGSLFSGCFFGIGCPPGFSGGEETDGVGQSIGAGYCF